MFVPPKLMIHIQPWETFFAGKVNPKGYEFLFRVRLDKFGKRQSDIIAAGK
jgi:hypothetical protein